MRANRSRGATKGRKRAKSIILIVCESLETEIQYFEGFKDASQDFNIHVVKGKTQDPVDLVKDAMRFADKEGLILGEENGDAAWCVFDVDDSDDARLTRAKQLADQQHVKIALSNPCIELWFLLHFLDTTRSFESGKVVVQELLKEGRLPNYQKNRSVFHALDGERQQMAITRAERLNKHHEVEKRNLYSRSSNPSTQIFKLVRLINNRRK
ncbi:MAG: RloB family protein [Tumebacillaceae bacterium]